MSCTWGNLVTIAEKAGATKDTVIFSMNITKAEPEVVIARVFDDLGLVVESI